MLRDINLKMEYNSESDNILQDFFAPCFSACSSFDRCVDSFALTNMVSLVDQFNDFAAGNVRMRLMVGHKFGIRDVTILSKIFLGTYRQQGKDGSALNRIMQMAHERHISIRIAVPSRDDLGIQFNERLGIFGDTDGNAVAFTGTLFSPGGDRRFETLDVFTSWDDPERVARKRRNFQSLWSGRIGSLKIYDFVDADKRGLLKYASEWAVNR